MRYTIKQMAEMDSFDFAICILNERLASTTNPYAPLAEKIGKTKAELVAIKGFFADEKNLAALEEFKARQRQ